MSWFRCRSCHLSSHRALPVRLAWPDRALDERSHVTPFDAVPRMPALNPVPLGGIGGGGAVAVGVAGGVVLVEDHAEQAGLVADERVLGPLHRLGRRGVGLDHEDRAGGEAPDPEGRSEEQTSEIQSIMRISYAVFCLKNKKT